MAENHQGNAGTQKPVVSDELSVDAFATLLGQPAEEQATEETDSAETEEAAEEIETEQVEEAETDEPEEPEESEEVDFDQLTPEQLLSAAQKNKSRLLGDLGKARKEARELRAQLDEARREKPAADPLEEPKEVRNPRIAGLNSLAELKTEKKQAVDVAKWAQGILDEFGAAQADEVIFSEGDKELTKKQLLNIRNSAQEAIENDIPARLEQIQKEEQLKRLTAESEAKARELVPEIADETSPIAATQKALLESPVLAQAIERIPGFKGVAALVTALAASKIEEIKAKPNGKTKAATTAKEGIPKPQAPGGAPAAGAAAGKPGTAKAKEYEQKRKQFEGSGSVDDYAALIASGFGG